ncbi:MAG: hypothetical protein M4579_000998 [Chaenotheca gracillima]|nr:MAG: hypothetical protein M4579_000998 [Chaenotheca gracillima]
MEVAPGPLARTHTAPVSAHARGGMHARPFVKSNSQTSHFSPYSSQPPSAANSRVFSPAPSASTTTTSLASGPPNLSGAGEDGKPTSDGPVVASDSIINQVADSSRSLYQICRKLRQRLHEVPGFDYHIHEIETIYDADPNDPVESLWWCFRRGYPLLTIYNALQPEIPLQVDESRVPEGKRAKTAAFKFVQACLKDLQFPSDECFLIMDLYGEDTTGFVKVTTVINRVLDILQQRGLLLQPLYDESSAIVPGTKKVKTQRDWVVAELVDTERKYVQDLESLQQFKKLVEEKGEVPGDTIHAIFLNLNALLDFQRRFLIRIETMNALPEEAQNWGQLFTQFHQSFLVYEPYIANQQNADEQATKEFEKLQKVGHQITIDRTTLSGFIMRPFQRLSKYPLLLKELRDKCDLPQNIKDDLTNGIMAASSILERANAAIDRQERQLAVQDVLARVEDWKGHTPNNFGELLLYGNHIVLKSDGRSDVEKEYKIYLFEMILLCCKDFNQSKNKNKVMGKSGDKKNKPKLQLKGRIFLQNVTDILKLQKPGSYTIQIFWKGDPGVENFVIRFINEEVMNKWYQCIDDQRKAFKDQKNGKVRPNGADSSDTQFAWVRDQAGVLQNPYRQEDEPEEEDETYQGYPPYAENQQSEFVISRNASSTSLRSRSTTGESGPPMAHNVGRGPPPRFPIPPGQGQNLTLKTRLPPNTGPSPGDRGPGASYFSPTVESPVSVASRGSSSSSAYAFPRQTTPSNAWPETEQNRFTAPAMGHSSSRDAQGAYVQNGRQPQRPGLQTTGPQNSQQARLRSASSPDIHNALGTNRRPMNPSAMQPPVPEVPVPPFPAHMAHMKAPVNRSQSNSPTTVPNTLPTRAATQSPGIQRERLAQHNQHAPQFDYDPRPDPRTYVSSTSSTPVPQSNGGTRTPIPALHSAPSNEHIMTPTQLKVKVSFDNNYVTLVIGMNISYQSLVDRIDAKLSRFTNSSIGRGTIRLRYQDEDGDFVTIRSDEDINIAFTDWKEQQRSQLAHGQLGEIQLYCQGIDNP